MILRDRDANANPADGLEQRHYVQHDANFNVTAITDPTGTVVERYLYDPYGQATVLAANCGEHAPPPRPATQAAGDAVATSAPPA